MSIHKANIEAIRQQEKGDRDYWWGTSYETIVAAFGAEVLAFETIGSYQGDHLVLLRDGERYGFTVIGYGSCSGCDSLEAAGDNVSAVQEIADDIFDAIRWEESAEKMAAHLNSRDAAKDWYLTDDGEGRDALDKILGIVRAASSPLSQETAGSATTDTKGDGRG